MGEIVEKIPSSIVIAVSGLPEKDEPGLIYVELAQNFPDDTLNQEMLLPHVYLLSPTRHRLFSV